MAILFLLVTAAAIACGGSDDSFDASEFDPLTSVPFILEVRSPSFDEGAEIPVVHTCDGEDEMPVISWQRPPDSTGSIAVIIDDPDAPNGIFSHMVVFNLPGNQTSIRPGIKSESGGPIIGVNDFGRNDFGGPCPPQGETHEYRFNVYALLESLDLDESAEAEDVLAAMRGSVIGHGTLAARYGR